jgi:hypothetical protein
MLNLSGLQACLELLGAKVSVYAKDDGPTELYVGPPTRGKLVSEVTAAIVEHKARLIELAAGGWSPDPPEPDDRVTPPVLARRPWRTVVARWPVQWRERWGRRSNELQDRGLPWDAAEWVATCELEPTVDDAVRRGEAAYVDVEPGMSDSEAVEAIDRAFGDGTAVAECPTGSGPRTTSVPRYPDIIR